LRQHERRLVFYAQFCHKEEGLSPAFSSLRNLLIITDAAKIGLALLAVAWYQEELPERFTS
jgi:hypothetical protein